MVSISSKAETKRTAVAVCSVHFSNSTAYTLIRENRAEKGDVLGVARIAGIMAAKQTANLIPLCHPIAITQVAVEVELASEKEPDVCNSDNPPEAEQLPLVESIPWVGTGQVDAYKWSSPESPKGVSESSTASSLKEKAQLSRVDITATVSCEGKTGVEMEALTAASMAALTVYDMCKAVDKRMRIEGLRVVRKEGGKSGTWVEGVAVES